MTGDKIGLDAIETASLDELRHLQLQGLKQTLQHAYNNSPVYKKKFDDAGVHPDDLTRIIDMLDLGDRVYAALLPDFDCD